MRTGAAGVLVGFGGERRRRPALAPESTPLMATAVADVAGARRDYMDESGGRYVHVIADGGLWHSGDIAKAFSVGADAGCWSIARARDRGTGRRMALGTEVHHSEFPRGNRVEVGQVPTARTDPFRSTWLSRMAQ
jgi:IMP dehydrogenase